MTAALVLLIFAAGAAAMATRRLPALLALPAMALAIGGLELLLGGLTVAEFTRSVVSDGATRLSEAATVILLGGILSAHLQRTGVAQSIVRRGAEFAGESALLVVLMLMAVVAVLFTTITGLGALVLVGTIVLPILASLGIPTHVAASSVLFGACLGGLLNPANWTLYTNVLGLQPTTVSGFAVQLVAVTALGALLFCAFELARARLLRIRIAALVPVFVGIALVAASVYAFRALPAAATEAIVVALRWLLGIMLPFAAFSTLVHRLRLSPAEGERVSGASLWIPAVPLCAILLFSWPPLAAFLAGIGYAIAVTWRRGAIQVFVRSCLEGGTGVMPALLLLVGLGMLLNAILGPSQGIGRPWPVLAHVQPLFTSLVPSSTLGYVLTFGALAPLALYRGPLNVWGLGYPIAGALLAAQMPAGSIMAMLLSVGILQSVSDPTNTANVWIANEARVDVGTLLRRTLPWTWGIAILGLLLAARSFFA